MYPSFFQHCFFLRLISFPGCHLHTLNISPQLLDMLLVDRLKWIPVFRVIPVPVCEWAHTRLWATHTLLLESESLPSNFFSSHKTVAPVVAIQKPVPFIYLQSFHASSLPASTVSQLALTVVYMPDSPNSPQNTGNTVFMFYKQGIVGTGRLTNLPMILHEVTDRAQNCTRSLKMQTSSLSYTDQYIG